jgi:hypothetical protein
MWWLVEGLHALFDNTILVCYCYRLLFTVDHCNVWVSIDGAGVILFCCCFMHSLRQFCGNSTSNIGFQYQKMDLSNSRHGGD